jgi:acyl carrier protein
MPSRNFGTKPKIKIEITLETALIRQKVLDSLDFINYITIVEIEFGIKISDEDIQKTTTGDYWEYG